MSQNGSHIYVCALRSNWATIIQIIVIIQMILYDFKAAVIVDYLIQLCCAQPQDQIECRGVNQCISGSFVKTET